MKSLARSLTVAAIASSIALPLSRVSFAKRERRSAWNVHTLTGKLHVKKMLA